MLHLNQGHTVAFVLGNPVAVYLRARGWYKKQTNNPEVMKTLNDYMGPSFIAKPVEVNKWSKFVDSLQFASDL